MSTRQRRHDFYTGRSGQFAVMAEFLRRGYNAAIPEIDVGEDVFVIQDDNGELSRVQVAYHKNDVLCNGISLQAYRDEWTPWPFIQH